MELASRPKHDIFLPDGSYRNLEQALRPKLSQRQHPALVVYAFDWRTQMLPYSHVVTRMAPAGARAIGAALDGAGVAPVRILQQQWTGKLDVTKARLDGKPLELLLISAMQIHSAPAYQLIEQAWRMGEDRPLILAGGPKGIYEPHDFFALGAKRDCEADAVILGEEFVLLELMERVIAHAGANETLRQGFERARQAGALENVLGLMYRSPETSRQFPSLVHTGIPRLLRDMDELPHPIVGFNLLEPPHRRAELSAKPLESGKVHKHSWWASLVVTHGCKFHCSYCPIPAYNQRTWRYKSPDRLADEFVRLHTEMGFNRFFGTDDNMFNQRETIQGFFSKLAEVTVGGKHLGEVLDFATEATEHDVYANRDLLPLARQGGLTMIYFGLEDLAAELVKKGQSPDKTRELFPELTKHGIAPMVMMMHYETQPLRSDKPLVGLLDQVDFVRDLGAVGYQCTVASPAIGSQMFTTSVEEGQVFMAVDGKMLEDHCYDGNHVVMAKGKEPWAMQEHVLKAYKRFFNFRTMFGSLLRSDACKYDSFLQQAVSIPYLIPTWWKYRQWIRKLQNSRIKFWHKMPALRHRVRLLDPTSPVGGLVQLSIEARLREGLDQDLVPKPPAPVAPSTK